MTAEDGYRSQFSGVGENAARIFDALMDSDDDVDMQVQLCFTHLPVRAEALPSNVAAADRVMLPVQQVPAVPDVHQPALQTPPVQVAMQEVGSNFTELDVAPSGEELPAEDWHQFRVREKRGDWTGWGVGIISFMPRAKGDRRISEGVVLRHCVSQLTRVSKVKHCMMKVGMCLSIGTRWSMYVETPEGDWRPTHMFLLAACECRSTAGMLEAALILHLNATWPLRSVNLARKDLGGTGSYRSSTKHEPHFVYVVANQPLTRVRP